jgi:hypothetical protein
MKRHFYIGNDCDIERCKEAFRSCKPIDVGGIDTLTGRPKSCTVLAVEPNHADAPGEHWRITVDDGAPEPGESVAAVLTRRPAPTARNQ